MRTDALTPIAATLLLFFATTSVEAKMLSCSIEASREEARLHLVAYASSPVADDVHSQFNISKRGLAGTSQNRQAGTYAVEPGARTIVGEVTIYAEENDDVSATLDVDSKAGAARCSYPKG